MKTLFLKSNLLHIRTNEGEFEVSNPEGALSLLSLGSKKDLYDGKNIEWPHGVERVSDCSCQVNKTRCWGPCGADTTVKIRLIPEEKKAESAYKEIKDKTASTSVVREGEWPNTSTPPSFESPEPQEEMWKELIDLYDRLDRESYGYTTLVNEFKNRFTITRKPE